MASSSGSPRPARVVLVVEDDPQLRDMIGWTLDDEGIPHVPIPDGGAAVSWLRSHRPAVVLLDIGLPVVDGFGVAEALHAAHGDVPVIVMTAGTRAVESARRVGAADFLPKPFDLDDLIATVRRALGHA
jgi:DNA-binding response OmpR family regulator